MERIKEIRQEIEDYIYDVIVPLYAAFDPAHREDHATDVIDNSMQLYRKAPEGIRTGIDPEILATAAACHDLGRKYGKIVAEADRLIDTDTVIRRTILYGMSQYPELAPTEQIDRTLKHLYEKYGDGGYLRLWIPWSDNALRLLELRSLLADHNAAREEVVRIFRDITKNGISGD